jgi:uncharacterized membrane protein YeaQ/YmgE (transglycosylase-associated protein family)
VFDGPTWYVVSTVLIGFAVGIIAKLIKPGNNEPQGFLVTVLLGMAGAFVASFAGQFVGFYRPGEQAGFIGSVVGAVAVLFLYSWMFKRPHKKP